MRVAPSLFLEFSGSPKSLEDNAEIVGREHLSGFFVAFEFSRSCELTLLNTNCVYWYLVHALSVHSNLIQNNTFSDWLQKLVYIV